MILKDGIKLLYGCLFVWSAMIIAQVSLLPSMCFYHDFCFHFLMIQSVIVISIIAFSFWAKERLSFGQACSRDFASRLEQRRFALAALRHDIRSPLSGILLTSRLLYQKTDHPELKHLQHLVVDAAKRALETVDNMDVECDAYLP